MHCLSCCIYLQTVPDNVCKVAGCKAVWGHGNQLFVTAGSRKPFRGAPLYHFYLFWDLQYLAKKIKTWNKFWAYQQWRHCCCKYYGHLIFISRMRVMFSARKCHAVIIECRWLARLGAFTACWHLLYEFTAMLNRWTEWGGCRYWCSDTWSLVGHRHAFTDDTEACEWNVL